MISTTTDDAKPSSLMDTTTTQSDTHDPRPITPSCHSRRNYEWQKSIRKSFHPARRDGTMACGSNAHRHDRRDAKRASNCPRRCSRAREKDRCSRCKEVRWLVYGEPTSQVHEPR